MTICQSLPSARRLECKTELVRTSTRTSNKKVRRLSNKCPKTKTTLCLLSRCNLATNNRRIICCTTEYSTEAPYKRIWNETSIIYIDAPGYVSYEEMNTFAGAVACGSQSNEASLPITRCSTELLRCSRDLHPRDHSRAISFLEQQPRRYV